MILGGCDNEQSQEPREGVDTSRKKRQPNNMFQKLALLTDTPNLDPTHRDRHPFNKYVVWLPLPYQCEWAMPNPNPSKKSNTFNARVTRGKRIPPHPLSQMVDGARQGHVLQSRLRFDSTSHINLISNQCRLELKWNSAHGTHLYVDDTLSEPLQMIFYFILFV